MKIIIFISTFLLFSIQTNADPYPFTVNVVSSPSNFGPGATLYAYNSGNVPITFRIVPNYVNGYMFSKTQKRKITDPVILPPLTQSELFKVTPEKGGANIEDFSIQYYWTFGDPNKTKPQDYSYAFPYSNTLDAVVEKVHNKEEIESDYPDKDIRYLHSHKIVGHDGYVITSRPGRVFDLRISEEDKPNASDEPFQAYVKVMHFDGTWSEYYNLPFDSIVVKLNQLLNEGDVIAKADSFNFAIQKPNINAFSESLPYQFSLETGGNVITERIVETLDLEEYDPSRFAIPPWMESLTKNVKTKNSTYLIASCAVVFLIFLLSIVYFAKKFINKRKLKKEKEKQDLMNATFTDEELIEQEKKEQEVLDLLNQIQKIQRLKNGSIS